MGLWNQKTRGILVAVLVAGLFGASCTRKGGEQPGDKVMRYSTNGASTNLDPTQANTVYDSMVLSNIYDTLYTYKYLKRPYTLKPQIADGMPTVSKDGLTYTFKVQKGVRYADDPVFPEGKGREVVAEDFVYGMKRHFDPKSLSRNTWLWRDRIVGLDDWKKAGADYSKEVEGLRALDSHTIQIKLVKPFPQLVYTLAMVPSSFIPKEAVDKYGKEFSVKPVGSGPFQLQSFNTKKAVMVRNPNFREQVLNLKEEGYDEAKHGYTGIKALDGKKLPLLDRIELSFMKQPSARWASFTKGNEIQFTSIPVEQLDLVVQSKDPVVLKKSYSDKYHMQVAREFGIVYSNFNMDDPEVGYNKDPKRQARNKALRCAVRKAFNWPERIKRFYHGIGEAYPGFLVPGIDGYDPNLSRASITPDYAGAKKLLKDNGWTAENLPTLNYGGVSSVITKQFFEQFRGWMSKIGYPKNKIKFQSYATFGDYSKAMKARKVRFHGLAWSIDYPDAENLLALYYGPYESPGANSSNFKNKQYDALYRKAATMQPSPERSEIYKKMNKIIVDECVNISGFSRTGIYLWHKDLLIYPDRDVLGGGFFRYAGTK